MRLLRGVSIDAYYVLDMCFGTVNMVSLGTVQVYTEWPY